MRACVRVFEANVSIVLTVKLLYLVFSIFKVEMVILPWVLFLHIVKAKALNGTLTHHTLSIFIIGEKVTH